MRERTLFRLAGRLARWPLNAVVRPRPRLNRLVWDAQYALGMWNYLDCAKDGDSSPATVARHLEDARILDLGCGTTANLPLTPGRFRHYHGVDISRRAIARARALRRPNTSFEVADILTYESRERYDAILLREVLYYFPTERVPDLLQRLSQMLEPGGRILVSIYDVASPSGRALVDVMLGGGLDLADKVSEESTTIFVLATRATVS